MRKMNDHRWNIQRYYPLFLALLVVLCYSNSLRCGLVYDDLAAIRDNRDVRPHTPVTNIFLNDFWGTPLRKDQSHKSYRPLTVLTFRMNYAVHGLSPFGYHLVNIFLHFLVTFLFYRFSLHFLPETTCLLSAALFAVHPVHTEAVTSVVGRAELLSAAAFLCALLYYINSRCQPKINAWHQCSVTALISVLGMLCKEQALTVLAVCCIYELAFAKNPPRTQSIRSLMLGRGIVSPWLKDRLLRIFLLAVSSVVALSLRLHIMGPKLPTFSRFDNPASMSSTPTRQLTYNYLLSVNAWLLLFPYHLCCDWTMATVPLVTCFCDVRNLATILLYIVLFWIVKNIFKLEEESKLAALMSLSLIVIPFLPATNLFFPLGFVVAERVLYIPSIGYCMLVALGCQVLWERRRFRPVLVFALSILLLVHATKTVKRNDDWRSEYTLYSSGLSVNRHNAKLYNNMGQVLESLDRQDEALKHYEDAIRMQPDDMRGYLNVGRMLTTLGRYQEAESIYLKAKCLIPQAKTSSDNKEVHVTPNHLQLFLNLAFLISKNNSRLEEADALYRQAINLRSDFTNAYLSRGDVLLKMNRTKEAEAMYHAALRLDESNPDLYFNLGVVLMDQGRNLEALDVFNKALDIDPDHEKALVYSAVLIQETGLSNLKTIARNRLEKIVDQGKENERVYMNLGLMALDNKDYRSAERWFREILQVKPSSREALFNLALLLSEQQHYKEALPLLNKLLQHHPNHINGLILLADIYVNYLRDLTAAEECYKKVLKLEPENVKALHNMCVVHVERQDIITAESCFLHATTVHPQVEYIKRHLAVVRDLLSSQANNQQELDSESDTSVLSQFRAASPSVS